MERKSYLSIYFSLSKKRHFSVANKNVTRRQDQTLGIFSFAVYFVICPAKALLMRQGMQKDIQFEEKNEKCEIYARQMTFCSSFVSSTTVAVSR